MSKQYVVIRRQHDKKLVVETVESDERLEVLKTDYKYNSQLSVNVQNGLLILEIEE